MTCSGLYTYGLMSVGLQAGRPTSVQTGISFAALKQMQEATAAKSDTAVEGAVESEPLDDADSNASVSDEDIEDVDAEDEDMDEDDEDEAPKKPYVDSSRTLFIRNLPFHSTDEDIEDHFSNFGAW